ncbi:hypothetical protein DVDV_0557 [Desulfovibrio sp. DV]|nr:hypothetical protein DVDV_0557 [Desulfovibrio sp. DV]
MVTGPFYTKVKIFLPGFPGWRPSDKSVSRQKNRAPEGTRPGVG